MKRKIINVKDEMNKEIFGIWLMENDWDFMPYIYEICFASMRIFNPPEKGYKHVLYVNRPIKLNFISKDVTEVRLIDKYFPGLVERAEKIVEKAPKGFKYPHMSDYIRYNILKERGGIYVDCDMIAYNCFDAFIEKCKSENKSVCMAKEDKIRICNAFMAKINNNGDKYFEDLIENYDKHYVHSSYTFNSIKYLLLLNRRYQNDIQVLPVKGGFFYPNWQGLGEQLNELKQTWPEITSNENSILPGFEGYATHLYNSDVIWQDLRKDIDRHLYDNEGEYSSWYIIRLFRYVIEQYIELMQNAEERDISEDSGLLKSLAKTFGEDYANTFKK